jgi:hypothetical protein
VYRTKVLRGWPSTGLRPRQSSPPPPSTLSHSPSSSTVIQTPSHHNRLHGDTSDLKLPLPYSDNLLNQRICPPPPPPEERRLFAVQRPITSTPPYCLTGRLLYLYPPAPTDLVGISFGGLVSLQEISLSYRPVHRTFLFSCQRPLGDPPSRLPPWPTNSKPVR